MTSISFGGGPSVELRRDFAGLPYGAHVPGYVGYCPQRKYRIGNTYGRTTHELAMEKIGTCPPLAAPSGPLASNGRPILRNKLPQSTGDNKYTENMVPGYTGYIPRRPFYFGGTYKEDCDVCFDDHLTRSKEHTALEKDLKRETKEFATLQPVRFDPCLRDHMNTYRDTGMTSSIRSVDRRAPTEAPIPGYKGYIPRFYPADLSLGNRFHDGTRLSLEDFYRNNQRHRDTLTGSNISVSKLPEMEPTLPFTKRLFVQSGMIPKYTGYLPQRRYNFGETYGNSTRSLEACAHDKTCFGEYSRSKAKTSIAAL